MNTATNGIEIIKICAASFLLKVPDAGVSWIFNPWPDISKFLIQRGLAFNGVVYPDRRMQGRMSCNLIEFPLMHALFGQGMYQRGEKPCIVGTPAQLTLAGEAFRRGLYGFYDVSEMEGCGLSKAEREALMREIVGLAPGNCIQPADALFELVSLLPLEERPTQATATSYRGLRIWKQGVNLYGVAWKGREFTIDCNLERDAGETYRPPLKIDVKHVPYTLYQIIDTGEEDGFSPKSCMHTVIQWRDKIICIDLPMNVSYLLNKISVSPTEIDAVLFTHNHDDHIGELSLLLQMDKKVTVICPRIIWKSILLKAANVFGMQVEELAEYFDYHPIGYGTASGYNYGFLRIEAHPSIHPVPCAIYRICGLVDREYKTYAHLSDILNFKRCRQLADDGVLTGERFEAYKAFLLSPATVKKVDVGTREGKEDFSVHGSWKDFVDDATEHIVLGHARQEDLPDAATVTVGQFAVAGSSRDLSDRVSHTYQDKYRERALKYLTDYLFSLVEEDINNGSIHPEEIREYVRILADNEIRLIQPNTPFLKMGEQSTFVDVVISGVGSIWVERSGDVARVANVNAGDVIGDMGVLQQTPRNAFIRADTYLNVLRIPGPVFREIAILLRVFIPTGEGVLQRIWRLREIVQGSQLFADEVPIYLQNKIAQYAEEIQLDAGAALNLLDFSIGTMFLGVDANAFTIKVGGHTLIQDVPTPPVFGERGFLLGEQDVYHVVARETTTMLKLCPEKFRWIRDVPVFKLRLKELVEHRAVYVQRTQARKQ